MGRRCKPGLHTPRNVLSRWGLQVAGGHCEGVFGCPDHLRGCGHLAQFDWQVPRTGLHARTRARVCVCVCVDDDDDNDVHVANEKLHGQGYLYQWLVCATVQACVRV
jgi:hypothetical protein